MDEKAIWRDWSPPKEAKSASASGGKGSRPLISRSAPKRVLDCSRVLDARLSRKDSTATSEAMPITTQAIERSRLPKLRPPPRQAARQIQGRTSCFMQNPHRSWLGAISFPLSVRDQPAAFQANDSARLLPPLPGAGA